MSDFITAYSKATGRKQRIPSHWLSIPAFARQFTKTPRQKKADERATKRRPDPVATPPEAADVADTETPEAGEKEN